MQLRCHMGAALYRTENVQARSENIAPPVLSCLVSLFLLNVSNPGSMQVLQDVHIEGFVSQTGLIDGALPSSGAADAPIKVLEEGAAAPGVVSTVAGTEKVALTRPTNLGDLPGMAFRGKFWRVWAGEF